ncbi:MAG: hypothetical protein ACXIVD_10500 [Salinarimonas sp.]
MLPISLNKTHIADTRIDRGDGFSIDPPAPRRTGTGNAENGPAGTPVELSPEVEQRLREINASPLMHLPRINDEETGPNLCTGPGAWLWGVTPGSMINAVSAEQFPPTFLLYGCDSETGSYEYASTFFARPVTKGTIDGFNSGIFSLQNWSAGGVATVRRFDDEERGGQIEAGPGLTIGFEIPGPGGKNVTGVLFANMRGSFSEFPDGVIPSDFTGTLALNAGIAISGGDIASLLMHSAGTALSGVPKPAVAAAGQSMIGASNLIDALTTHLADVKFGFGERVEARYENGEFTGIFYRGERIELEDMINKFVEQLSNSQEPPLIPDGGNPVIAEQNIRTRLAFNEDPFIIAHDVEDSHDVGSIEIARGMIDFVDNTMRPNAYLLSEELQQRMSQPLSSINDFGALYDDWATELESQGMGHLRDEASLTNEYGLTGGSAFLYWSQIARNLHTHPDAILQLPTDTAIEMGILPEDYKQVRQHFLGSPDFDEAGHTDGNQPWADNYLQ